MDKTLVYLVLGIPGSGRREVLLDLIENGLEPSEKTGVMLPQTEEKFSLSSTFDALDQVTVIAGSESPENAREHFGSLENLFAILPGVKNPVESLDAWKAFLYQTRDLSELARILTVIHCEFLKNNPGTREWFEACIHFSDVVLLNRREGAGNRWVNEFQKVYQKKYYPCHFELVRKNGVRNPAHILNPESRRLSLAFDFWQTEPIENEEMDVEISASPLPPEEEDEEIIPEDPYFATMPGGRRKKSIPKISDFLS